MNVVFGRSTVEQGTGLTEAVRQSEDRERTEISKSVPSMDFTRGNCKTWVGWGLYDSVSRLRVDRIPS